MRAATWCPLLLPGYIGFRSCSLRSSRYIASTSLLTLNYFIHLSIETGIIMRTLVAGFCPFNGFLARNAKRVVPLEFELDTSRLATVAF